MISEDNTSRSRSAEEMKRERQELEEKFRKEQEDLKLKMEKEAKEREAKEREMNQKLETSKASGRNELIELFEKVRKDLEDRKKENEELRNLLNAENSKRQKESEDIKENLSNERKELKDYIDSESFGDETLKSDGNSNDVVRLFRAMKEENERRKRENDLLKDLMAQERKQLEGALSKNESGLKDLMTKNRADLKQELENQSADLCRQVAEDGQEVRRLREALLEVRGKLERPVVYFAAVREDPYCTGGEEYLTFSHCNVNKCGDMDPKSGVFTASVAGKTKILVSLSRLTYSRLLHVLHHCLLPGHEEGSHGHQEKWRGDRDPVRPEPHRQPQEQHGLPDSRHRAQPRGQDPGQKSIFWF